MGFWLKRGVAGFRFDAITTLFEDPEPGRRGDFEGQGRQPGHQRLRRTATGRIKDRQPARHPSGDAGDARVRGQFGSSGFPGTRVLIGETYLPNIAELAKHVWTAGQAGVSSADGYAGGVHQQAGRGGFSGQADRCGDAARRQHVPLLLFDNHDNPRIDARYGDGVHDTDIQRVISTVLFASRGAHCSITATRSG